MEIRISVLNTNTTTNETVINDFVIIDGEWESGVELPLVDGEETRTANESFFALLFLCDGFGKVLDLSEDLDFDDDVENVFPIYTASDRKKRKRGYIYDFNEKDGIKTRIILIAPKNFLPSFL